MTLRGPGKITFASLLRANIISSYSLTLAAPPPISLRTPRHTLLRHDFSCHIVTFRVTTANKVSCDGQFLQCKRQGAPSRKRSSLNGKRKLQLGASSYQCSWSGELEMVQQMPRFMVRRKSSGPLPCGRKTHQDRKWELHDCSPIRCRAAGPAVV